MLNKKEQFNNLKSYFQKHMYMEWSFQDYSWIQDFEADFP